MPSSSDVAELVAGNRTIRAAADRDLRALWLSLNPLLADETRDALLESLPGIVLTWSELAGSLAADLYDEWRFTAIGQGGRSQIASLPQVGALRASIRYAVGSLYQANPDAASVFELLSGDVVSRAIGNASRGTMERNSRADTARPRWARIPVGKTCRFCVMLASRGAAYHTDGTALAASHGNCDCVVVPEFAPGDLPDDYDPEALYEQYKAMG